MKKLIFSLTLITFTSLSSLALAAVLNVGSPSSHFKEASPNDNNKILQKWFTSNHIAGKHISTDEDAKKLTEFPQSFTSFKIRIIKYNSVVTMDFSPQRINFTLDQNEKIVEVSIG